MNYFINEPTIMRDVSIFGNVWPTERPSHRDLRFHFHNKDPSSEVNIVKTLLCEYTNVHVNPVTFHIKCIIKADRVPLVQRRLKELGLQIKWVSL